MSRAAAVFALAAALALTGCAAGPALRTGAPTPPPAPAPAAAPAPAPARAAPAPGAATLASPDTIPSADALAVLAGIPEPLGAEARGASPAAPAAARPTTLAPARPDSDDVAGPSDVPVPARTPVLGERPLPEALPPVDTVAAPPAPAAPPLSAAPDTCWRVQFAAWADRGKAEGYLDAARSQLAVPLAIEKQAGLFKVRTTACLDGAAADALRRRAHEAGFDGAFRFRGGKP